MIAIFASITFWNTLKSTLIEFHFGQLFPNFVHLYVHLIEHPPSIYPHIQAKIRKTYICSYNAFTFATKVKSATF